MDEVKDKMKGLMKKVNNPFSSSPKFKGQGHVLGSAPSSSSVSAAYNNPRNPPPPSKPIPKSPAPSKVIPSTSSNPTSSSEFTPFDPLISSSNQFQHRSSGDPSFECPVCSRTFLSESDVSVHIDHCLAQDGNNGASSDTPAAGPDEETSNEIALRVAEFISAGPPEASVEVALKLLGNVARDPGNEKFRRIRMGNSKIKEAIVDPPGGLGLLECVGFKLGEEEDGEVWAIMEVPSEEAIAAIKEVITLLGQWKPLNKDSSLLSSSSNTVIEKPVEPKKIDRQVRVFFSVTESEAAKIDLPVSFYNLSAEEIKREAALRKKKLEDSQLLIPKSYREKQAMAARRKYKRTLIRIQFPDGVVLQGVFLPWESTTVLYEFVGSALKEPNLEFELLGPAIPRRRLIPCFPQSGERAPTLEDENLVPSALIKFKPLETDSIVFTGLTNELLEVSEPLVSSAT